MKILAMYLPQFHRVKENDIWWGEGFTEWTAVKNARKLFPDHNQPREPLDENYYDLMQKQTMIQQADSMHKYGIDGMCFYHYYFKFLLRSIFFYPRSLGYTVSGSWLYNQCQVRVSDFQVGLKLNQIFFPIHRSSMLPLL